MNNSIAKIFLIVLTCSLPILTNAQYKYKVSLGGNNEGLRNSYGNHIRFYYNFSDYLKINTEFARYFEAEEKGQSEFYSYDIRSIDLNVNYGIMLGDNISLYAILGFDYTFGRKMTKNATDTTEIFLESLGLNAGFGAYFKIGRFVPYVEFRNMSSSSSYLIYSIGLGYSFGKDKD